MIYKNNFVKRNFKTFNIYSESFYMNILVGRSIRIEPGGKTKTK